MLLCCATNPSSPSPAASGVPGFRLRPQHRAQKLKGHRCQVNMVALIHDPNEPTETRAQATLCFRERDVHKLVVLPSAAGLSPVLIPAWARGGTCPTVEGLDRRGSAPDSHPRQQRGFCFSISILYVTEQPAGRSCDALGGSASLQETWGGAWGNPHPRPLLQPRVCP